MKKRMSRILSILLAFALIVSAGDVVQAEDVDGQTAEVQEMTEAEGTEEETQQEEEPEITVTPVEEATEKEEPVVEDREEADVQENNEAESAVKEETQVEEKIEAEEMDEEINASDTSKLVNTKANGTYYDSKPIVCSSKGVVIVAVNCTVGNCHYGLFKDAALNTRVSTSSYDAPGYVNAATGSETKCFSVPQAGTYYVGVYSTVEATVCGYAASFYDGSDRTLANGQAIVVGQRDAQTNYFAFRATSTGYITVQGDGNGRVALCNSSKGALSGESYLQKAPTYGVKAGVTYYFRVTNSFNWSGTYVIKATNSKISGKFGKTKKKASTIKKKKTRSGYIEAGSAGKKAKWYKFKVTKKKKVKIAVTTGSNEALKLTIYKGGRKITSETISGNKTGTISSIGKWSKGTYYIKVQRANSTSSGYYKLKWS